MPGNDEAKEALDKIIRKSRVHMYKPIQIAEILYHHRAEGGFNLDDLQEYRNKSKQWRDIITQRLVGRVSTSSQKFQDNIFEANAIPPATLATLGEINEKGKGFVELYIYKSIEKRLRYVHSAKEYIEKSSRDSFSVKKLASMFIESPGLKRSVDKMYEITVYALFSTIMRALRAEVTLSLRNADKAILIDFGTFIKLVLGMDSNKTEITVPASLYRVGVANAADRGIDMWANFGPAIQVKHLSLTADVVEYIAEDIKADRIVIVCLDSDKPGIDALLKQIGWGDRIQGIITLSDLDAWYELCLGKKYGEQLGKILLGNLAQEFDAEFPSLKEIEPFMHERNYHKVSLPIGWEIKSDD